MNLRWLPALSLGLSVLALPAAQAGGAHRANMPDMDTNGDMSGMNMTMSGQPAPAVKMHQHHYDFGRPAEAAQATRTIDVAMNDMSFVPAGLSVKAGETITFHVINKSGVEHEFVLDTAAGQAKHRRMMAKMLAENKAMTHRDPNAVTVAPGESADLTWTFTRPARLEYDCNIPGHYESGMKGELTVGS